MEMIFLRSPAKPDDATNELRTIGQTTRVSSTMWRTNRRKHPFDLRRKVYSLQPQGFFTERRFLVLDTLNH